VGEFYIAMVLSLNEIGGGCGFLDLVSERASGWLGMVVA